jgi:ABC-type amino acid transport substrate-binding protein
MRNAIEVVAAAFLLACIFAPAKAQDLKGTLKKVKENSTFTIGHRDSSIPLSYLDDKLFLAGLALNTAGSFVKGLMPVRCFVAGFLMTTNFANPGTKKAPVFFSSL